jgi:hypothetical protein
MLGYDSLKGRSFQTPLEYPRLDATCATGAGDRAVGPASRLAVGVSDDVYDAAKSCFTDFREIVIPDSGHSFFTMTNPNAPRRRPRISSCADRHGAAIMMSR